MWWSLQGPYLKRAEFQCTSPLSESLSRFIVNNYTHNSLGWHWWVSFLQGTRAEVRITRRRWKITGNTREGRMIQSRPIISVLWQKCPEYYSEMEGSSAKEQNSFWLSRRPYWAGRRGDKILTQVMDMISSQLPVPITLYWILSYGIPASRKTYEV